MKCSELRRILEEVEDMCGDIDVHRLHAHPILGQPSFAIVEEIHIKQDAISHRAEDWAEFGASVVKPPYVVLT